MLSEIPRTGQQMLSPRAEVARLTLQLRSTLEQIAAADAEADAADSAASLAALNDRIGTLIEQRRVALDSVLAAARTQADDQLAAANAEAARIIAAATPPPAPAPAPELPTEPEPEVPLPLPPAATVVDLADVAGSDIAPQETGALNGLVTGEPFVWPWIPYDQDADARTAVALDANVPGPDVASNELPAPDLLAPEELLSAPLLAARVPPPPPRIPPPPPAPQTTLPPPTPFAPPLPADDAPTFSPPATTDVVLWRPTPQQPPPPVNVVIDAESFARAFASALGPILEAIERSQQAPTNFPPPTQSFRVVQTPPPKKSFWANAWHADVLLSAVAVVIVLAVLVAWTS